MGMTTDSRSQVSDKPLSEIVAELRRLEAEAPPIGCVYAEYVADGQGMYFARGWERTMCAAGNEASLLNALRNNCRRLCDELERLTRELAQARRVTEIKRTSRCDGTRQSRTPMCDQQPLTDGRAGSNGNVN